MYAKLFTSILTSSIWEEDYATRVVWVSLLAMANEDGIIEAIPSAIARIANMQPAEVETALEKFQQPDPASRSPEHDGRRIDKIEGGYAIPNYPKYRDMKTRAEQREEWRKKKQLQREKQNVPNVPKCLPMSTHTYTDADTDADTDVKTTDMSAASPTSASAAAPPAPVPECPVELVGLELYEKDKKLIVAWPELLPALVKAYPGINIGSEVAKAHAWEVANPQRRKVNRSRFLHNWFARAQDKPQNARYETADDRRTRLRKEMLDRVYKDDPDDEKGT